MSWDQSKETITLPSASDLSTHKFKVVELNSDGNAIICNSVHAFGIVQNQPKSGEAATVVWKGFTKALAAGAINAGQHVRNSSGWCTPVLSGAAPATYTMLGRAMTTAASGGQFTLCLDKTVQVASGGLI